MADGDGVGVGVGLGVGVGVGVGVAVGVGVGVGVGVTTGVGVGVGIGTGFSAATAFQIAYNIEEPVGVKRDGNGVAPVLDVDQPSKVNPLLAIGCLFAGLVKLPMFPGSVIDSFEFSNTPTPSGAFPESAPLLLKYVDQTSRGFSTFETGIAVHWAVSVMLLEATV